MSCGCHCGSIRRATVAAPVSPLQIVPADDIVAGWDAAVRVAVGAAVFTLPDVSGNGFNLDQAVALNQPALVVGGGPNGNDSILFDGVNDFMVNAALDLPAPGTTPTTYWGVLRQITWTIADRFWDNGGGDVLNLQQGGVGTPDVFGYNGVAGLANSMFALNTYMIIEAFFSNSPSDFVSIGGTVSTGAMGNDVGAVGNFVLGAANIAGALASNIEFCELWIFRTPLSIQQRAQLRAYATARYGAIP